MNDTIYQIIRALKTVGPRALLNAATGAVEGALHRPRPLSMPATLDIVLTKACNLRCIFCISYDSPEHEYWMDFELYKKMARELFPTTLGVFFCSGGEPLLYPHIREALMLAKEYKTQATMTSNGMLLDEDVASWMVADQSLQELCISFDGARKATLERIRKGANYERILENLERLGRKKIEKKAEFPRTWFRFAIMRSNAEELPDMITLCKKHGLYKLEVKPLLVSGDIPAEESLKHHPQLAQEVFEETKARAKENGILLSLPSFSDAQQEKPCTCTKLWDFAQIDPDGSIRICYYCWKQRLGNIKDGFTKIWRGEHYAKIRSTQESDTPYYPYCKTCEVRFGPKKDKSNDEKLLLIPGLEELSIDFNTRKEENVNAFKNKHKSE